MTKDLFKNTYRISTIRARSWDYSSPGDYFVTICVKNMKMCFGKIEFGKIKYSLLGREAYLCWKNIPKHFPFVEIDEFVIMPNHVHGIICIRNHEKTKGSQFDKCFQNANVETQDFASLQGKNVFGPQSKNLASIVRGFKIGVTKFARSKHTQFEWQPRYYEKIISTDRQLEKVRQYIEENPYHWRYDPYFCG